MTKKSLEDLAKQLGYKNFGQMREAIGIKKEGFLSSLFSRKKKETSPTKEGEEQKPEEPTIGSNILPFLPAIRVQLL